LGHNPGTSDEDGEEVEAMDRLIVKAARVAEEVMPPSAPPAADPAGPSEDAPKLETNIELSQLGAEENTPSSKRKRRSAPGSGHLDAEDAAPGMVPQPSDSAAEGNVNNNAGARFVRRSATNADAVLVENDGKTKHLGAFHGTARGEGDAALAHDVAARAAGRPQNKANFELRSVVTVSPAAPDPAATVGPTAEGIRSAAQGPVTSHGPALDGPSLLARLQPRSSAAGWCGGTTPSSARGTRV
jgi:hypothetical protein